MISYETTERVLSESGIEYYGLNSARQIYLRRLGPTQPLFYMKLTSDFIDLV